MAFTIKTRQADGALVLEMSGRLVAGESVQCLADTFRRLLDDGHRAFVLSLARVSHMDTAGLGQVLGTYSSAKTKSGRVVLLSPSTRTRLLLQIAKLVTIFDIYEDEATAIAALTGRVAIPA